METQTASSPRHEMEMHVRLGAMKDGTIRGIDLYTLSNTGAYSEQRTDNRWTVRTQIDPVVWKC